MNSPHIFKYLFTIVTCSVLMACHQPNANSAEAQSGVDTIDCWVDSSLMVLAREEVKAFDNIYKFPRLDLSAYNESDIVKGLVDNKVNLAILHRLLDSNELAYLTSKEQFKPKQYEFAYDAYVFISARASGIDSISYDLIAQNLRNKKGEGMTICVENPWSQSLKFLKSHFNLNGEQLKNINSPGSMGAMMSYLRNNPGTFGVIPFSIIADIEADKTLKFLDGLKVLKLVPHNQKGPAIEPSQSTIATKEYPLISPIVLVNCNMDKKSGTNFVNYIFKTKSQRLIQQFGLCPAIFPGREYLIQQ